MMKTVLSLGFFTLFRMVGIHSQPLFCFGHVMFFKLKYFYLLSVAEVISFCLCYCLQQFDVKKLKIKR